MSFLEKLNYLMEKNHLNKSTLSKACDIPYTTIDGWYKKGYEGLKLTTLRKLADFFGTTLDYWASNTENESVLETLTREHNLTDLECSIMSKFLLLDEKSQIAVMGYVDALVDKLSSNTSEESQKENEKSS